MCSYISKQTQEEEKQATLHVNQNPLSIDDTDAHDQEDNEDAKEEEFQAWKLRELYRYKREKEERELIERERMQVEALRVMSMEEKNLLWSEKLAEQQQQLSTKTKYKFLQKYYHKGAYYQNSDPEQGDYDVAAEGEVLDRLALPEVMQVKNFGKKGRTKWTHLTAEDTTMVNCCSGLCQRILFCCI